MLGGAFGIIVTLPFPELSSGREAYAIVGMGAVAGAVLGAPISTIMVIFELTGDYALTIAVMIATVVAALIVHPWIRILVLHLAARSARAGCEGWTRTPSTQVDQNPGCDEARLCCRSTH